MSNPAQSPFVIYRAKATEELIDLLRSDSATVVYRSLVVLESRKVVDEDETVYELLKDIAENGKTFKNRNQACVLIRRFFPKWSKGIQPGESRVVGYVYFILNQEAGTVKIGRAKDLERRMDIFTKKFEFPIELIQFIYTLNYEKIEMAFHRHYHAKRREGEWFALSEADIVQIKEKVFPSEIEVLIVGE